MTPEQGVIDRLTTWAESRIDIRAMLLTSSMAVGGERVDALSDYDIVLVVINPDAWARDAEWLAEIGTPLVRFFSQIEIEGAAAATRLVIYEDSVKIDYSVWPVALLAHFAESGTLPEGLDIGYRILVDKDSVAEKLAPPTYQAHIPPKPTEQEYQAAVEEFWWESSYVAKNLWRDELIFARHSLDHVMKTDLLLRMLEWRVEVDHDWSLRPGLLGRGIKKLLPAETWQAFESTFAGPNIEENWRALFATIALFRRTATEVGAALGYEYPLDLDRKMTEYLKHIQSMPPRGS